MTADDIVDILLEAGVPEEGEDSDVMSRFVRNALFKMEWKRKPHDSDSPVSGDYRLEFETVHGYTGSVAFSLTSLLHRKLIGNVSVTIVLLAPEPYSSCRISSRWRPFTIKQNQVEQFRAAWQKFVREQIPVIIKDGVPSKMRLAAQVSKVLKPFQPTKAQLATDPDIERLKALFDKADIPAEELAHVVDEQDQHENGHTSAYEDMMPEDVRFWTNWVLHWAQQNGKQLE